MSIIRTVTAISILFASTTSWSAEEVVLYTARKEQLVKPVIEQFTKDTGIQVKIFTGDEAPLIERLKSEGAQTPADLYMTADAGNLWYAAEQGIFQPVTSKILEKEIPSHLRDPKGEWFGLSIRARTIVYNPGKVQASEISTYEDLARDKWKGKLCLRTSKKVYNQSLVAMLIATHGEKKTEDIIKGWVKNLATDVFPDDTKLLEAIASGQCALGIANTYYYGRILKDKPDFNARLFWPNQGGKGGVHVNISGAGVTKHAKHKENAIKLLEWLASAKGQNLFADVNQEYPVNPAVKPAKEVQAWGDFEQNLINVSSAGRLQSAAVKLMDRAGYK